MASTFEVRPIPCEACPYRRDVPSGVWAEEEYAKLLKYEGETFEQSPNAFGCHATPTKLCHGWAAVSGYDSMALRILGIEPPEPKVPLFDSHLEAAQHGLRDVTQPGEDAVDVIYRLRRKHARIREGQ